MHLCYQYISINTPLHIYIEFNNDMASFLWDSNSTPCHSPNGAYKILLITFKALHGMAPAYICELITPRQRSGMKMRSDEAIVLIVPPNPRLPTYGDRAFYIAAPVLWNSLPVTVRQARTLGEFKSRLKTYLFQQAYPAE